MPIRITEKSERREAEQRRKSRNWFAILAFVQLPITLGLLALGYFMATNFLRQNVPLEQIGGYTAVADTFESMREFRFPVKHWLGLEDGPPRIDLDITQEDYRALEYASVHDRTTKEDGELRKEVYVKADIRYEGQTIPAKIRLKGDRDLHWVDPEVWSFRVELKGDNALFNMRSFSLQKPITRNYVYEWFFHKTLKHEGLIGLRYDFVELYVNGKSRGIYAVEELFDKTLLESNNRREAPIVRFSEGAEIVTETGGGEDISVDWYRMPVSAYGKKRWAKKNPEILRDASNLLEDFQYGRKSLDEIFDIELLARYFALIDLLDSFHGALEKSIRFYYNPINQKLEPIGFDSQYNDRQFPVLVGELSDFRNNRGYSSKEYFDALFGPDIYEKINFWEAYVRELERVSQPEFLDQLFADLGPQLEEKLDLMYAEISWHTVMSGHPLTTGPRVLFYFSKDKLYTRQTMLRERLTPHAAVTGYRIEQTDDSMVLELANAQKLPIEVMDVVHEGILYKPTGRILLNEKPRYSPMNFERHEFVASGPAPAEPKLSKLEKMVTPKALDSAVRYRVPGSKRSMATELFSWVPAFANQNEKIDYNRFMDLEPREFFDIDEANKTVSFKAGNWQIDRDVVVPGGYTLLAGPGTTIDLVNNSRVVSFSPIKFKGLLENPIVVKSSDASGRGRIVLEAEGRSNLDSMRFEGMTITESESWVITSVVTFHRSNVDIVRTIFGDNNSEDALNIVRSEFTMKDVRFQNTFGDAFDSDFSNGTIEDTIFSEIGNDAIDVSGSKIIVRNVTVESAGDKGISVGEASRLEAEFTQIHNSNIGVAVKDLSYFEGMTLTITDSNVGFTLFQKKPEYGPSRAIAWRTVLENVKETHWLEEGSSLEWNGSAVAPNRTNLRQFLYPDLYGEPEQTQSTEVVE